MDNSKKINTDRKDIEKVLSRYVENIYPSRDEVIEQMSSGKKLSFYWGTDPTGVDIHLGHTTNLLFLKNIISLGHEVIVLIGDFTAQIGDPTGKDSVRKVLSEEEVKENMKSYLDQIHKILEKDSFKLEFNSKWLSKMNLRDIRDLMSNFTVQQMIIRDMFQERLKNQKPIYLHEFLYPIMQGYDSVAMDVDGEVGGNDQMFNMLVGRDLLKSLKNKDKIVITTKLLEDPISRKKIMNKSEGQYISLRDSSKDMFGKVMAMPDFAIIPMVENVTQLEPGEVQKIKEDLESGINPKEIKIKLAQEIVRMYFGEDASRESKDEFDKIFSKKELPDGIESLDMAGKNIVEVLVESGISKSKSEAKRLVDQGGIHINDKQIEDWEYEAKPGDVVRAGPRKFLKIK